MVPGSPAHGCGTNSAKCVVPLVTFTQRGWPSVSGWVDSHLIAIPQIGVPPGELDGIVTERTSIATSLVPTTTRLGHLPVGEGPVYSRVTGPGLP